MTCTSIAAKYMSTKGHAVISHSRLTISSAVPPCCRHIAPAIFHTCGSAKPIETSFHSPNPLRRKSLRSMIPSSAWTSAALFAIGPGLSKKSVNEYDPATSCTPTVGFRAYRAARDAGVIMEPIVSAPTASGENPAATATADPVDDPPGAYQRVRKSNTVQSQ